MRREQAQRHRAHNRFSPAGGLQFLKNMRQVILHGPVADVKLHANGFIGQPAAGQRQYLQLTLGKRFKIKFTGSALQFRPPG
jgi:hypothetical protein